MPTTYYEAHPTMQRAIKAVVMVLDRGDQPPEGMDSQCCNSPNGGLRAGIAARAPRLEASATRLFSDAPLDAIPA
jgi:hypothetical protein